MKRNSKYLSKIPKPLLDDFVNNKVVPIVGAGFSKNADIPPNFAMPDWNALGKMVAEEINGYEYNNNALDTLSYYEMLYSRPKLIELLIRKLHIGKIQPGPTYRAFCELFTNIVCTTNFDCLLEDAYRGLQQPISVIATEDRLSIASEGETRILKLHGDVNHPDRMVVTETDYDIFTEKNPVLATYISSLFITNTMLLVGYSLDDYDFRSLWQIVNNRLGKMTRPAYCIAVGATQETIARYKRRNIQVIDLPGKVQEYKEILLEFFEELKEYIADEKAKIVQSTDERITEQFVIPAEDNHLCFISCPWRRESRLMSILEPIMHDVGVTPIRFSDLVMPGNNWMERTKTAIRKSNLAIVDITNEATNVMFEAGILAAEKPDKIIYIAEKGTVLRYTYTTEKVFVYSSSWDDNINIEFAASLKQAISNILDVYENEAEPFAEANRLIRKKEYSASVVSVMSELEQILSKRYYPTGKRRLSFMRMLDEVLENENDAEKLREISRDCVYLRNRIVHEGHKATKKEAESTEKFAKKILDVCERKIIIDFQESAMPY